jgi:hypothetical protein
VVILGHIAGLPVQESLAYVAPVLVVVGWIYWAGRRERRRAEHLPDSAGDDDLDELLGPDAPTPAPPAAKPALTATRVDADARRR